MGQQEIKVERGLARGARQRFTRLLEDDSRTESHAIDSLLVDLSKKLRKKLSNSDIVDIVDNFVANTKYKSLIRTSRIKHSQTSAATTVLRFFIQSQSIAFLSDSNHDLFLKELTDDDFKDSEFDSIFVLTLSKLFLSRSQFEFLSVPLFINFNNHFVERWCTRSNSIDTNIILRELAANFGFIEYIRNTFSLESSVFPVAFPFDNGLALGSCEFVITTSTQTKKEGAHKIAMSFRPGQKVLVEDGPNPFSHHFIFNTREEIGTPTVNLKTFISFSEMKSSQRKLYTKIVNLRNRISEPMLNIYDVILARPPDEIKRKNPVPNFDRIAKVFQDSEAEVSALTHEMISSGLWERSIQHPRSYKRI